MSVTAATEELAGITANFRQYLMGWGETQRDDGGFDRYRSGLATPQFNGVLRIRSLAALGRAVATARTELAGVPWWWWAGPDSPEGTPAALIRHGAVPLGTLPLMVRPLDRAPDPQEPPSGLRVEAVESPDRLAGLVGTYRTSMGIAPELQPGLVRFEADRADNADVVRLAAVLDGEVVGTTVVITAHDVAGIFLVHVAESHRRRGIGAALTTSALRVAHDRGTHRAALLASPAGEPLYRRFGFTRVSEYRLFSLPA
ncbi:GNAT family N-acetyltransferase [Actinacidiphila glaucinigra]|uniref:GNAT family N-acetyltransferase n=1 Tax=Actinacidiphila glaucinigra TaxID=235986 RepID=UPI002DDB1BB7|nr:GNAT family N-acetyltransferase [Actinacidiphila glaucinigra]WSD64070.1 GNAT family N-acetyltransferase [Actinacidiphila glaucinigra]